MQVRAEMLSVHEGDCERGHARHHLRLPVRSSVTAAGGALVHNLSETGLQIKTFDDLTVGEVIQVDLPEAGGRSAMVVWRSDQLFGCQFERPIAKGAVSASLLRSPPTAPTETVVPPAPQEPSLIRQGAADVDSGDVQRWPLRTRALVIVGLSVASWALVGIPIALVAL